MALSVAPEGGAAPTGAASPRKRPRGAAASSELVAVYGILLKAGKPLTVPEIAEQMPRTGFASEAMRQYTRHKEQNDPTWLEGKGGRWSPTAMNEAMEWWVRKIVSDGVHTKKFKVKAIPGRGRGDGTYEPGVAPKVRRMRWVEQPTLVE